MLCVLLTVERSGEIVKRWGEREKEEKKGFFNMETVSFWSYWRRLRKRCHELFNGAMQ